MYKGGESRPARLKGVAEDNLLMEEVVDNEEIEKGLFQRRIFFVANISDE